MFALSTYCCFVFVEILVFGGVMWLQSFHRWVLSKCACLCCDFYKHLFQDLNVMFFCVVPGAGEFVLCVLHICAAVYPSVPQYQYAALWPEGHGVVCLQLYTARYHVSRVIKCWGKNCNKEYTVGTCTNAFCVMILSHIRRSAGAFLGVLCLSALLA